MRDDQKAHDIAGQIAWMRAEIERLRAETIHLRRVGMDRPSAELHEAALEEMRAENARLRARVEVLELIRRYMGQGVSWDRAEEKAIDEIVERALKPRNCGGCAAR